MKQLLLWCLLALGPLALGLMATGQPVMAAEPTASGAQPVPWNSLSSAQQQTLSQFEPRWTELPPERQLALSRGADRWGEMNEAQRDRARERFQRWRQLPEPRRERARERWNQFQKLPPAEQARLREDFREFRQLPEARRAELRRQWQQKSVPERQQMLQDLRNRRLQGPQRAQPPPQRPQR